MTWRAKSARPQNPPGPSWRVNAGAPVFSSPAVSAALGGVLCVATVAGDCRGFQARRARQNILQNCTSKLKTQTLPQNSTSKLYLKQSAQPAYLSRFAELARIWISFSRMGISTPIPDRAPR
jgi:hypothetical protein